MPDLTRYPATQGGWKKYPGNPVMGDAKLGTCFDVLVFPKYGKGISPAAPGEKSDGFKMYFSWRPKKSLATTTSADGVSWSKPKIILGPNPASGWEDDINRNAVVEKDGVVHIWYTGFAHNGRHCWIGYAAGTDDDHLVRLGNGPCLTPEQPWEYHGVMNPCVLWDEKSGLFKMWYSAGETYEPNVICYAESDNGFNWRKRRANPVFTAVKANHYEQDRIGGCQVLAYKGGYLMFYIGYEDINTARICGAWSPDGVTRWERFKANPLVSPEADKWDGDACYKPGVLYDEPNKRWLLWYNGRHAAPEYIGLVIHEGEDLWK
ncbi:MAG: hypothetical protein LBS37_01680 [Treponema sp.]|jgi:hypothetical protein|nr:hypothetical protein [Treponema sp.]